MSTAYSLSLLFLNESSNSGDVCLFQTLVEPRPESGSVVWLKQRAVPRTRLVFQWKTDYAFVWSNTVGTLLPGALITASQIVPADLTSGNQISLSHTPPYNFSNQTRGPQAGTLTVVQDRSVPSRLGVVGIGMADQPTIVVPMQPNVTTHFPAKVTYWITFTRATVGQLLSDEILSDAKEVSFPPNVTSMSAILREDNSWEIAPAATMSARFARSARSVLP